MTKKSTLPLRKFMPSLRLSDFLRHPQQRAARSRIAVDFGVSRASLAADELQPRLQPRSHHRQIDERGVDFRLTLHEPFDEAVLERVKTDDGQPPAAVEDLQRAFEPLLDLPQLIVDE